MTIAVLTVSYQTCGMPAAETGGQLDMCMPPSLEKNQSWNHLVFSSLIYLFIFKFYSAIFKHNIPFLPHFFEWKMCLVNKR